MPPFVNRVSNTAGLQADVVIGGEPGYWLTLIFGWHDGRVDQVRILVRPEGTEPSAAIYDTKNEFTITEAARTALDAGNVQVWLEP